MPSTRWPAMPGPRFRVRTQRPIKPAFESHLWPSESSTLPPNPVPIAFVFASFLGDQVWPNWVTNVSDIEVTLDNKHGGTYIVHATATYDVGGSSQSCTASVSGGMETTMPPIPLQATNLVVEMAFVAGKSHRLNWASPIPEFPDGQIIIDLYGVWPGSTSAKERTSGENG